MRTTADSRILATTPQLATNGALAPIRARQDTARQPDVESQMGSASRWGHRFAAVGVRPALRLGPVDGSHEEEADRAAADVMAFIKSPDRNPTEAGPRITPISASTAVQRSADGAGGGGGAAPGAPAADVAAAVRTSLGGGRPLPGAVQGIMEDAFGTRFHQVRIHADANSHALNRRLGARAFTAGNDVFFKGGHYSPDTRRGLRLLAHELAHTLQQRSAGNRPVLVQRANGDGSDDDELERQFDENQVRVSPKAKRPSLAKAMHEAVSTTEQGTELPGMGLGLADVAWFAGKQGGERSFREYAAHDPFPTSLIGGAPSVAGLAAVPQEAVELGTALGEVKSSWSGPDRRGWRGLRRLGTAADKGASISSRVANAASFSGNLAWHGAKLAGNTDVVTGAGNFLTVAGQVTPGIGIATGTASLAKSSYAAHKARKRMARLQEMLDEKPTGEATSALALERQFRDSAVGMDGKPSSPEATSDFEIESQFGDSAAGMDGKHSPVEATSADEMEDQFQESATDLSRRQLIAYALRNQGKRANRAAVNITSSALQTAGNIVSTAGAPAPAGVAIAAAGTGVKYGAMAVRKIKQKARDVREGQGENRSKLGKFIDKVFDPDVERSTNKKKAEREQMTDLLIGGGHHDVFELMGAKPEHMALLQKPGRTQTEEQTLRAEVKRLFKKRE